RVDLRPRGRVAGDLDVVRGREGGFPGDGETADRRGRAEVELQPLRVAPGGGPAGGRIAVHGGGGRSVGPLCRGGGGLRADGDVGIDGGSGALLGSEPEQTRYQGEDHAEGVAPPPAADAAAISDA